MEESFHPPFPVLRLPEFPAYLYNGSAEFQYSLSDIEVLLSMVQRFLSAPSDNGNMQLIPGRVSEFLQNPESVPFHESDLKYWYKNAAESAPAGNGFAPSAAPALFHKHQFLKSESDLPYD